MASITIPKTEANLDLASSIVTVADEAKITDDGKFIHITSHPSLIIPRAPFDAAHGGFTEPHEWRALVLDHEGYVEFTELQIVITDEKDPRRKFMFVFPNAEAKERAKLWADRSGYRSLSAYILAALEHFNKYWEEKAGVK